MPKPITKVDWSALRLLAASGVSLREIARQFHLNPYTVLSRARREGWNISETFGPTNSARLSPAARKQLIPVTTQAAQVATSTFLANNNKSRAASAQIIQKLTDFLQSLPPEELLQRCRQFESVVRSGNKVFNWSERDPNPDGALYPPGFNLPPDQLIPFVRAQNAQLKTANAHLVDPQP